MLGLAARESADRFTAGTAYAFVPASMPKRCIRAQVRR